MKYTVERVKGDKKPYKVYEENKFFWGLYSTKELVKEFEVGLKARKYAEKLNNGTR